MCQPWSLIEVRLRCWEISAADMDPFTSCLLAKMSTLAFFSSYNPTHTHTHTHTHAHT